MLLVKGKLEGRAAAGHTAQDALLSFTVFALRTGVRMHFPHLRCMLELCGAAPVCSDACPAQARGLTRKCSGGQGWEAPGLALRPTPCCPGLSARLCSPRQASTACSHATSRHATHCHAVAARAAAASPALPGSSVPPAYLRRWLNDQPVRARVPAALPAGVRRCVPSLHAPACCCLSVHCGLGSTHTVGFQAIIPIGGLY